MGRVAMSCDDLRQALPLLPGTHPDDEARVRAHAVECEACGDLLRAYEGDGRVLSTLQQGERKAPPILDGFTASVMARIAEEQKTRAAPVVSVAPATTPPGEAELLRPAFGLRQLAVAAAVLLAVAVGLSSGPVETPAPTPGPGQLAVRPDGSDTELTQPVVPVMSPTTSPVPLPAPRRVDAAPMPQRRRGPIVPVGEGSGRDLGRGGRVPAQGELLDAIEQFLPNLHRRMLKEFGDERGEREVRF